MKKSHLFRDQTLGSDLAKIDGETTLKIMKSVQYFNASNAKIKASRLEIANLIRNEIYFIIKQLVKELSDSKKNEVKSFSEFLNDFCNRGEKSVTYQEVISFQVHFFDLRCLKA